MEQESNVEALSAKIVEIGKKYYPSEVIFPLGFLIPELERRSLEAHIEMKQWVFETMKKIGVPLVHLFRVYDQIFSSRLAPWGTDAARLHLLVVLFFIIYRAIEETPQA